MAQVEIEIRYFRALLLRHWTFSLAHQRRNRFAPTLGAPYREKHWRKALRHCALLMARNH